MTRSVPDVAEGSARTDAGPTLAWRVYLGLSVAAIVGHYFVAGSLQPLLYDLIGASALLAVVLGIRWNRPRFPLPWLLLAAGQAAFLLGDITWNYFQYVRHVALPSPSVADALYVIGYPLIFGGLWLLIRIQRTGAHGAREGLIDSLIVATAATAVTWILVINKQEPQILHSGAVFVGVLYPFMGLFLVGVLARMLFSPGERSTSFQLLNASVWCLIASDIAYAALLSDASLSGSLTSAGWLLSYVFLGTAALHPSMNVTTMEPAEAKERNLGKARLWLLALITLLPSAASIAAGWLGVPVDSSEVAIASGVLFVLVIVRMSLLIREVESGAKRHREMATIVHTSYDAIIATDLDTRITSWNPAAERIFGFTAKEAVGRTPSSLLTPAPEIDDSAELSRRVREGEVLSGVEVRRRHKDGTPLDISITVSPIRDVSGRLLGASTIARDVTHERAVARELDAAAARYRTLVEQVPVIIYDWAVAGDIDDVAENFVNPQIEAILGFDPKEWMADPAMWNARIHPEDRERVTAETARSIEEGVPYSLEYRMLAKDGHVVWLRDEAVVLDRDEQGRASLFQGVQLDITAEKVAGMLVRQNAEEKAQLIQLLAHELFTPITSIQGAALTLSTLGDRLNAEELSDLAEGVARGAKRLRRLVQNLDAAAKLDREDVDLSRRHVPVGEILALAMHDFQLESDASSIHLSIDEDAATCSTIADPALAAQALSVVIENALAYSGGENVEIDLSESEERLLIRVSDRGPGVGSEQRDRIFELFTQVNSSDTRDHEGIGVGLFLARRVMRVHGGELTYDERPDGGAMFAFHFVPARN